MEFYSGETRQSGRFSEGFLLRRSQSTRTESVYQEIKADILAGRLEPGERLGFAALNEAYGASVGVLREALVRLTAEGLTTSNAQHGFKVIALSLDDLEDLTATRCHIETMVLRDSIENGDIAWESDLVAAHHRMERTEKFFPGNPMCITQATFVLVISVSSVSFGVPGRMGSSDRIF